MIHCVCVCPWSWASDPSSEKLTWFPMSNANGQGHSEGASFRQGTEHVWQYWSTVRASDGCFTVVEQMGGGCQRWKSFYCYYGYILNLLQGFVSLQSVIVENKVSHLIYSFVFATVCTWKHDKYELKDSDFWFLTHFLQAQNERPAVRACVFAPVCVDKWRWGPYDERCSCGLDLYPLLSLLTQMLLYFWLAFVLLIHTAQNN